jgi:ABC-type glycerol-3-phosphate transport system substrate-binding protein
MPQPYDGTEPDIFYTYFTDLPQVLLAGQAADITSYVNAKTVPTLKDIVPGAMRAVTAGKTIYGLPTANYTQGLICNRALFSQAGLNPDDPPTTWAQAEADAKKIAALGHGSCVPSARGLPGGDAGQQVVEFGGLRGSEQAG